jgi:hypothetical protein
VRALDTKSVFGFGNIIGIARAFGGLGIDFFSNTLNVIISDEFNA